MKKYEASQIMELLLNDLSCEYVKEHKFHDSRKWRFDYAIPGNKIGIEIEGGTWGIKKSRHTTGAGYEGDCYKYNAAAVLGWRLLRYTTNMIKKNPAQVSKDIEKCMEEK